MNAHRVRPHATSKQELDDLRALIDRDLHDAGLAGLSTDRSFATSYNAALQSAKMAIACVGYRVVAKQGHHQLGFAAAELAIGPSIAGLIAYFETCRRKRVASRCGAVAEIEDPAPFPHPARRTGQADFPHPALGQGRFDRKIPVPPCT